MIWAHNFEINFLYNGKQVRYKVDKMCIHIAEPPQYFYRIQAKTGNRDVMKKDGRWVITNCQDLPSKILEAVGKAIEDALGDDMWPC
jgi:hypothetical protein